MDGAARNVSVWCNCPVDAGVVLRPGHEQRVQARAEQILACLRWAGGEMPLAGLRAQVGIRSGEALSILLDRGLIEHIGKSGTASAGYRLADASRSA